MYQEELAKMQSAQQQREIGVIAGTAATVPQPSGIASRVQELQKAVAETSALSYQLRTALGIQQPQPDGQKNQTAGSLAEVLSELRYSLNRSNTDLQDVLQHLNS